MTIINRPLPAGKLPGNPKRQREVIPERPCVRGVMSYNPPINRPARAKIAAASANHTR